MCVVLAVSVLSASFAVFLVRERASGSKAVQLIAGASPSAFWAANLAFDVAYYSVSACMGGVCEVLRGRKGGFWGSGTVVVVVVVVQVGCSVALIPAELTL